MASLYLDLVQEGAPILVVSRAAEALAQGVRRNQHNLLWITSAHPAPRAAPIAAILSAPA